jgi:hypothetical protein
VVILDRMNKTLRGRIRDRALATDLLRDLTILTAVSGLAATAGFGWLASMTFAGTPAANASVSDDSTTDDQLAAPTPRTTAPNAAAAPNAVATPRPTASSGGSASSGSSSSGVTPSRRRAHVSTGSS